MMMKTSPESLLIFLAVVVAAALSTSCHRLSKQAREIVGTYYIPEISNDIPLLELRDDATITVRAVKPEVLTYSLDGVWNVVNDSIVAKLDPSTLKWEGDSTLIGNLPADYRRRIEEHTSQSLTIERDGITYIYKRK